MSGGWGGRRVTRDRAWWTTWLAAHPGYTCPLCGHPLAAGEAFDVDHATPRHHAGTLDRTNQRPAHPHCNRSAGQALTTKPARRLRNWTP